MAEQTQLGITISSNSDNLNFDVKVIIERAIKEIKDTLKLDVTVQSEVVNEIPEVFVDVEEAEEHLQKAYNRHDGPYTDTETFVHEGRVKVDGYVDQSDLAALSFLVRACR